MSTTAMFGGKQHERVASSCLGFCLEWIRWLICSQFAFFYSWNVLWSWEVKDWTNIPVFWSFCVHVHGLKFHLGNSGCSESGFSWVWVGWGIVESCRSWHLFIWHSFHPPSSPPS
jgi:hypothetical protein